MHTSFYVWFLRGTTYIVAAVIGFLILTAAMPPLFSASTKRAVVNAPVIAVTAPIAGTIERWTVQDGERIEAGELLGVVSNRRIDRATLTHLEIRLAEVADRRAFASETIRSLGTEVAALEKKIAAKSDAHIALLQAEIEQAESRLKASDAAIELQKVDVKRQKHLFSSDVVSRSLVDEARSKLRAVQEESTALSAALKVKRTLLQSASEGVFVRDSLDDISVLENELRERTLELAQVKSSFPVADRHYKELTALVRAERKRLALRTRSDIRAPQHALITSSIATVGRDVAAGETLAHAVDCGARRVVAIFPQRHAQELAAGRLVTVTSDVWFNSRQAVVERVFPHTSDMVDKKFAVPFPPIERRELYAIIRLAPDEGGGTGPFVLTGSEPLIDSAGACDVGQWVEVSVGTGAVQDAIGTVREAAGTVWASVLGGGAFARSAFAQLPTWIEAALEGPAADCSARNSAAMPKARAHEC